MKAANFDALISAVQCGPQAVVLAFHGDGWS